MHPFNSKMPYPGFCLWRPIANIPALRKLQECVSQWSTPLSKYPLLYFLKTFSEDQIMRSFPCEWSFRLSSTHWYLPREEHHIFLHREPISYPIRRWNKKGAYSCFTDCYYNKIERRLLLEKNIFFIVIPYWLLVAKDYFIEYWKRYFFMSQKKEKKYSRTGW